MNDLQGEKAELRQWARKKGRELPPEYLLASDRRIETLLLGTPEWAAAKTLFIYLSMRFEPDTVGMLHAAWQGGKRVIVPRCLEHGIMEAREISGLDGLVPKRFGILEPGEGCPQVSPEEIDLVVAPCVAADDQLQRLGNGGGYYDRFLTLVQCPVICLCRGRLMLEKIPADVLDVPVSAVISEEGIFRKAGGEKPRQCAKARSELL